MDLSQLDLSKTADLPVKLVITHPITEEPLTDANGEEVYMMVLGTESTVAKNIVKARAKKQLGQRNTKQSVDEMTEFGSRLIASLVTEVHGLEVDGEPIVAGAANLPSILERFTWLREQLDAFVSDRANFFKA